MNKRVMNCQSVACPPTCLRSSICELPDMSLYQEIPKESIMIVLRERFSSAELDVVRLEIQELLLTCHSLAELQLKVTDILHTKKNPGNFNPDPIGPRHN